MRLERRATDNPFGAGEAERRCLDCTASQAHGSASVIVPIAEVLDEPTE